MRKSEKHKWVIDENGNKVCSKCDSSINKSRQGFAKYRERDEFGVIESVNWYPRCFPIKK